MSAISQYFIDLDANSNLKFQPADIEWKKLTQTGDVPTPRSGHSFCWVGGYNYMMFGGIEDNKSGNITSNNDIYFMKMGGKSNYNIITDIAECRWTKEKSPSEEQPVARTQHIAITLPKNDKVFVFGGHHSPRARLNDTWYFQVKDMEWVRVGDSEDNLENLDSNAGAPPPRANAAACIYKGKIYIFGGHGGLNYARVAFNDLYTFDLESETWDKIIPNNTLPEGRGGHSVFASDDKIYIYGGWNSEM